MWVAVSAAERHEFLAGVHVGVHWLSRDRGKGEATRGTSSAPGG